MSTRTTTYSSTGFADFTSLDGLFLSGDHVQYLDSEGISAEVATAAGAYSALEENDLPEGLRFRWYANGPGIVFMHHDIHGNTFPQYRPDSPADPDDKYFFEVGFPNSPMIHPSQKQLVGVSPKVVCAEGTKGLLTAITVAEAAGALNEVLFVSLTGVTGGVKDGVFSPDFYKIIRSGAEVVTFFDADLDANLNVWTAASKLKGALEKAGAKVRFDSASVYGKNGLSDWLCSLRSGMSSARVWETFMNAYEMASGKLPRKPSAAKAKASRSASGVKVLWDLEQIASAHTDDKGKEVTGDVYLTAAVRPTVVYEIFDDLAFKPERTAEFDLEVRTGGTSFFINGVPSEGLHNIRRHLSQLPYGIGESITMKPRAGEDIAEAIRAAGGRPGIDLPVRRRLTRSGWFENLEFNEDRTESKKVWRYVVGNLAIGPEDSIVDLSGEIDEPSFDGFMVEDPHEVHADDVRESVREVLGFVDGDVVDPTPLVVGIGYVFAAAAGMTNCGGEVIVGPPGSGKTFDARWLASFQQPRWPEMGNFEGTTNYVSQMGPGVHHAVMFVDDLRVRTEGSHRKLEDQMDAFEAIMRRMYGGGEYLKAKQTFDRDSNKTKSAPRPKTAPGFILTAEASALPGGEGNSNMERGLFVAVDVDSTFRPGGAERAKEMAAAGIQHRVLMAFTAWVAAQIDAAGMDDWKDVLKDSARSSMKILELQHPGIPKTRPYEIAGNALSGWDLFIRFASEIGALPEDGDNDAGDRAKQGWDLIGSAMEKCWYTFQGGQKRATPVETLASAFLSGEYAISGLDSLRTRSSATTMGFTGVTAGKDVVFIDPKTAAKVLGMKQGKAVGQALSPFLVNDEGTYTRQVYDKASGTTARYYAIQRSAWDGRAAAENGDLTSIIQMWPDRLNTLVDELTDSGQAA